MVSKQLLHAALVTLGILASALCGRGSDDPAFYFRTDVGRAFQQDIHVRYSQTAQWDIPTEKGTAVNFALGYHLTKYVAVETDGGWIKTDLVDFGRHECFQIPITGNLVLQYPVWRLRPYVGVGGGINEVTFSTQSIYMPSKVDSDGVWMLQVTGGLQYAVARHIEVGFNYRLVSTRTVHLDNPSIEIGPLMTHVFSGSVVLKF